MSWAGRKRDAQGLKVMSFKVLVVEDEIFVATDQPFGLIESTVTRD